jgi:hypothetical protein
MDAMEENLNPRSVSNALYELMVDWRGCVMMSQAQATKQGRKMYNKKRNWIEQTLGRFFNKGDLEMRALLEQHFAIKVDWR